MEASIVTTIILTIDSSQSVTKHLRDFSISDQSKHINTLTAETGRLLTLLFYEQGSCSLVLTDL